MEKLTRQQKIDRVMAARQGGLAIVLEDIHDPHNAGAVLRSAEAFGVAEVCVIFEQEKYVNLRRVGKFSSSSGNKWLNIRAFRSTKSCFAYLHRKGYVIAGTVLHHKAKDAFASNLKQKKLALLFGNEFRGLSPWAIAHADRLLTIPMRGFVESLNLSVTAGILLFEVTRQRATKSKTPKK